jgi:hypothetical protein
VYIIIYLIIEKDLRRIDSLLPVLLSFSLKYAVRKL